MTPPVLSKRLFATADQEIFAQATGDRNPVHMDPLAARRTQAGFPVVHGMHTVLWALDTLVRQQFLCSSVKSLKVKFRSLIYVGDTASLLLIRQSDTDLRTQVVVEGTTAASITVILGENRNPAAVSRQLSLQEREAARQARIPSVPLDLSAAEMAGRSGWLSFAHPPEEIAPLFPFISKAIGASQIAALACLSMLVGMECPGLHSIFASLDVDLAGGEGPTALHYAVDSVDTRYNLVKQTVFGGGLTGSVEAFARTPPSEQPAIAEVAQWVKPREFAESDALVIGGSRGLGELTAKIIAAGGGRVTVTYAVGKADAEKVATEIRAFGGACNLIQYNVCHPAIEQLSVLTTHSRTLYYFATGTISGRKSRFFSGARFNSFIDFYVLGFFDLCTNLLSQGDRQLTAFYPSSVFVEERPADMMEYAMAKAAGEILCSYMGRLVPGLRTVIHRLPRLATDQTASVMSVETASALAVLLPVVREVEAE